MTNVASNASPATAGEIKQIVLKEIQAKWGKFSEQDLSALKSNNDLVTQLAAKYSLEKTLSVMSRGRPCSSRRRRTA